MSVSKTINGGTSWSRSLLTARTGFTYSLAINPTNSNIIYAGGVDSVLTALYKSTNGGSTWTSSSTGLTGTVYSIAIDRITPSTLYAGSASGVFKSTNSGASWANTGCTSVKALVIDPNRSSDVYAGTASGVYKSTSSGGNWTAMNQGLLDLNVTCLAINPTFYLFAGTGSAGTYRWLLTGVDEETGSRLNHNLVVKPNPARGQTIISYTLPVLTRFSLSVYDNQGRLVKNLASTVQKPGVYTAAWNGLDRKGWQVPAGVYFVELATEQSKSIQKLILLR